MDKEFTKGSTYQSATHGLVEYLGVDTYMGQKTLMFKSITYGGGTHYWLPESLGSHFKNHEPTEQPVTVMSKPSLNHLIERLERTREFVDVGNTHMASARLMLDINLLKALTKGGE